MQKKVLLSIKPEFADRIFNGTKLYEFRRVIFKDPSITTIVVYASTPIKKVIGEFQLDEIITLKKNKLWKLTKTTAGIDKARFDSYFADKEYASALKVKSIKKYGSPLCLKKHFKIKHPPQSFIYLNQID